MKNKLLIISGPTSTGKTALAELVSTKIPSELISADSRQIYKGLDIGTGKDHNLKTKIHLVDILTPDQTFSSFDFVRLATEKIQEIQSKNKLPIVVGGTGFYLNALLHPEILKSPNIQNHFLFPVLNLLVGTRRGAFLLKSIYKFLDKNSFSSLNHAEQNNPQRLIKRILLFLVRHPDENQDLKSNKTKIPDQVRNDDNTDILHLHLDAPTEFIHSKIDKRAEERLESGLILEIQNILEKYSWDSPGLKTLAYQEFQDFFKEKKTLFECIRTWIHHEKQYVKRQKTYFKKYFPIAIVCDITQRDFQKTILKNISSWYNKI